jgi:hypothetical protein
MIFVVVASKRWLTTGRSTGSSEIVLLLLLQLHDEDDEDIYGLD